MKTPAAKAPAVKVPAAKTSAPKSSAAADPALDGNLLEVIARSLAGLRRSDRRVAEAVLADPQGATEATLGALARRAGVSEPTVLRFCAAVGCEGFRDLRVRLARSLAFARTTSHAAISPDDDLRAIVAKVFDFNLSSLAWARSRLDVAAVEAAVAILAGCARVEFMGLGASGVVALDAQQKFPLFGVPCGAFTDGHQMLMAATMLGPGSAVVGISNTGRSREVVGAVELARAKGAATIGVTGAADAPLAGACDVALVIETLENTDLHTPTISRLSALVMVDVLSTAVCLARGEAHRERLAEMKRRLAETRLGTA